MSEAPVEGAFGWVRVGCGLLAIAILPLWGMSTALVWALDPGLRAQPFTVAVFFAAPAGAFWLFVGLVLVSLLLGAWSFLAWIDQRRENGERETADLATHSDSMLPSDAWDNPESAVPTGLAPDDEPEPELPPAPPPAPLAADDEVTEPRVAPPDVAAPAPAVDELFGPETDLPPADDLTEATDEVDW